jgi:rod shape determining protein RodA|tara:strand:+ start:2542 stop:3771 length:1230 start_codon:yes stop_codon:yes gene_type:complete
MILSKNFSFSELPFKIIWSALFLTFIGLITLYSISQHHQGPILLNPFKKQLLFLIPALLICFLIICIPRYSIHKYSYAFYFIGIIIVVLPFFNTSHAGTYRWLDFGLPFTIQPSEFAKVFTVLALARYLSDNTLRMKRFTSIINPIFFAFIPTFIVMNQPDLGTSIVMMAPVLPMLYWAGAKPFYLFLILAPVLSMLTAFNSLVFTLWAIILGGVIFFSRTRMVMSLFLFFGNIFLGLLSPLMWNSLSTYQQNRILTFINPEKDPLGAAYQIIQSKTAIGSGGIFGKGWGAGTQTHLKFLPVQESDFILSVIGEEMGFSMILLILYVVGYLITQIVKKSYNSKDRFSSLALIGIATIVLAHVFVNTAMTVGLIPVKGLPFPLISAGGSFLISTYIMIGLVLKLSINYTD